MPASLYGQAFSKPTADHGLKATLQPSEKPDDDAAAKECLTRHPELACLPLSLTIKNEGRETILSWLASCSDTPMGIEYRNAAGEWKPFPPTTDLVACASNVLGVTKLGPGESLVIPFHLADWRLRRDTTFPADDGFIHPNKGYALLSGHDPLSIRANWFINGCVAGKPLPEGGLDPFAARSLCARGEPKPQFIVVRSNEFTLQH